MPAEALLNMRSPAEWLLAAALADAGEDHRAEDRHAGWREHPARPGGGGAERGRGR